MKLNSNSKLASIPPHKIIGVAVIWNDQGQILIDRRRQEGAMGGLWEFPGGKIELDETIEECIQREIKEELGIVIEVGEHLITIDHTYTQIRVTLTVHHCRFIQGVPQLIECDEVRWVSVDELESFAFPEANIQIIAALRDCGEYEEKKQPPTTNH
ncbi:MAG: 8-oxo-dGTP diphosphatase MutT [Nostochopsis sp.]